MNDPNPDRSARRPTDRSPHYFETPTGDGQRRTLALALAGREVDVVTSDGVFSAHRLDLGTRVLLREVPDPPIRGHLLDLGCGWGPLALTMALLAPQATVWAVDVNERALALTRENAARLRLTGVHAAAPDEVPDDLRFAAIWSNPPIRVGKTQLHALLTRWLTRLDEGAAAYLVVQRNLGADSLHSWMVRALGADLSVSRVGSAKGYRVLRVSR